MPCVFATRRLSFRAVDGFWTQFHTTRRFRSLRAAKKSAVFLGSPSFAADSLKNLLEEAERDGSQFEITGVVSQPDKPSGRSHKDIASPTPVSKLALDYGFKPNETLLRPKTADQGEFLTKLKELAPDVCIVVAYGNLLPKTFLKLPRFGTLNIHPSLLPKYRGAAPVSRALEDGVTKTGVSVVYTVYELDAGPILAAEEFDVDLDIQASELLDKLFAVGTRLLINQLPSVFDGTAVYREQKHEEATFAEKLSPEESILNFHSTAVEIHNKRFHILKRTFSDFELRILQTRIPEEPFDELKFYHGVSFVDKRRMLLQCGGMTVLEVLSAIRPGGRRPLSMLDIKNGLKKQEVLTL